MSTITRTFTAIAALAAGALVLSACSTSPDSNGGNGDGLRVVTSTTQLTDFARVVGGDDVTVTGLLTAGSSAHQFDPSPADLLELSRADVLIINGQGLDAFVDNAIEASDFTGLLVNASDGVDLVAARDATLRAEDEAAGHTDHEAEGSDHEDIGHEDTDHEAEGTDHEGHDHGDAEINPHLWTAPAMAAGMVNAVTDGLIAADPANAGGFRERATAYQALLAELDTWVAEQFAQVPAEDRKLVSGHDSLRYYLDAYDITFAGSILPSFEDNAEPSVAEIDALVAKIKEEGVRAIFVESTMSPKLARTIAKESGATVIDGDRLAVDALGADGSDTDTYLGATVFNTRTILEAWGVTPAPLPEALQNALK
jgi:ABC-type Zn uptake system ZnuABC Zn-binding protein ZnuA